MPRTAATWSLACAALTLAIWLANVADSLVPVTTCTITRMQVESWLFVARALAVVLPLPGIVLAVAGRREGSRAVWAAVFHWTALLYAAAAMLRWMPANRYGCLRS